MPTSTIKRNKYKAIEFYTIPQRTRKQIENLIKLASKADKIDEHDSWNFEQ